MQTKLLYAAVAAAVFAIPFSSSANTGKDKTAQSTSSSTQTAAADKSNDGGAEAMFIALDKNKDGFISKDEAKGTPHEAAFDTLDTNHDGKLSRAEHAAAPEHVAARNKASKMSSADDTANAKTASSADTGTKKY